MDDIEAIKQLKARYFRLLDTKEWDAYGALFTADVVVDTTGSGGERFEGRDAYMAFIRSRLQMLKTVHHGHMPEIKLTSPTTATGIWALEDHVVSPDGIAMNGQGHYHERYEKGDDGAWRIAALVLTRLRMEVGGEVRWG